MAMEASGRITPRPGGMDLEVVRSIALAVSETWEYLTDSELTERWFGPWDGDARAGGSVRVRMRFEEEMPTIRIGIVACDPERRLELRTDDETGSWHLDLLLEEDGAYDTTLRLVHHLESDAAVGEIGPGWEFYLDLLVAATEDTEEPTFDQYYPALREAYEELRPRM